MRDMGDGIGLGFGMGELDGHAGSRSIAASASAHNTVIPNAVRDLRAAATDRRSLTAF